MGSIKKIYSAFFIGILLSFSLFSNVHAEVAGPGWFMGTAAPVSHAEAKAYYSTTQPLLLSQEVEALLHQQPTLLLRLQNWPVLCSMIQS